MIKNIQTVSNSSPIVAFVGKTGTGKSSTINALWDKNCPVDNAIACTKEPTIIPIYEEIEGKNTQYIVVDLPGIAESLEADSIYTKYYTTWLSKANVVVWLTQADTRAYKQDEIFLFKMIKDGIINNKTTFILGINQADLLFKCENNLDGITLDHNSINSNYIQEKIADVYSVLNEYLNNTCKFSIEQIIPYSALQKWNITKFKNSIINNL